MTRCLGCMEEYDETLGLCPYCGYILGTAAKAQNHLAPGTMLIDRYLIGRCLGQGGFGITYIAWDSRLCQKVAIKEFMPTSLASRLTGEMNITCYNDEARDRFRSGIRHTLEESRRLARFHELEGVVKVIDCFEANQTAYIIMEFLKGENCKELLARRKRFSLSETISMMTPVLQALSEIHKSGLIHRDISPDNIFVCKNEKVKLLDFGAARVAAGDDEKSRSVVLKSGYAPKEQYSQVAKQGPFTDVYAVCATMYEMLTGKKPIDSVARSADADELTPIGELVSMPQAIADAIMQGLAIEAKDRHQTVDPILDAISGGSKTPPKKKGVLIAIGCVAATIAIVAAILLVLHGRGTIVDPDTPRTIGTDAQSSANMVYSEMQRLLIEEASMKNAPADRLPAFRDAAELRETLADRETITAADGGVLVEYRDAADHVVLSEIRSLQGEGAVLSTALDTYGSNGKQTAHAVYDADGTCTQARLFFYDDDDTLFTQSDYTNGALTQRNEYRYTADGTPESGKTFDADGEHLYSSVFTCDENGEIRTEKRCDPDGTPVYIRTIESGKSDDEKWYDSDGLVSRQLHREYKNDAPTKLTEYEMGEILRRETWTYKKNRLTKHMLYDKENALQKGWRWFYDADDTLSEVRQYNADGDLVLRVQADGEYTTYAYYKKGLVSERVSYNAHDEKQDTILIEYDEEDKICARTDYDGDGKCIRRFADYTPVDTPAAGYCCDVYDADDLLTETRTYTSDDQLFQKDIYDHRGYCTEKLFFEDGKCTERNVMEYAAGNLVYKEIWVEDVRTMTVDYSYDSDGSWTKQTAYGEDGEVMLWIEYRRLLGMDYWYDGNSSIPFDRRAHNVEIESFEDW